MNEKDVKIWNYGNYSSDNYGTSRAVKIGRLTLYFSYDTIVAFSDGNERYVCENVFSVTTGRHLNCIDGENKKNRLPYDVFQRKLEETLAKFQLIELDEKKANFPKIGEVISSEELENLIGESKGDIELKFEEAKLFNKIHEALYDYMTEIDREKKLWNRVCEIRDEYLAFLETKGVN